MPARTPEECDHLFGEYINSGDLDRLLKLYDPACSLVQRDGNVATGHAAIREVLGRLVAMQPKFSSKVVKVVKADNLATVYSDWTMSAHRPPEGQIELAGKAHRRSPPTVGRNVAGHP
jgi:ketosteroid isomerase-like protein